MDMFGKMFKEMKAQAEKDAEAKYYVPLDKQLDMLEDFAIDFEKRPHFESGQIITQKPTIDIESEFRDGYKHPKPGLPAIVLKNLNEAEYRELQPGTPSRKEDILIGVVVLGAVLVYAVDSAYFESFK